MTSFMKSTFCDISAIGAGKYPRDQFRGTYKEERRTIYFLNAFGTHERITELVYEGDK